MQLKWIEYFCHILKLTLSLILESIRLDGAEIQTPRKIVVLKQFQWLVHIRLEFDLLKLAIDHQSYHGELHERVNTLKVTGIPFR